MLMSNMSSNNIIRQGFSGNTTSDEHISLNIALDHFRPASQQKKNTQ